MFYLWTGLKNKFRMKLLKVKWRNFGSYGEEWNELDFPTDSHSNLNYLVGKNGFGKSTIPKVIKFGLYGKVDTLNLSDIPNRINKNAEVIIGLIGKDGQRVKIHRGLQPEFLDVTINEEAVDASKKRNIQNILDTEVYGIDYNVFSNIIILSINDFKSFLSIKPNDKREIVDRIFGFDNINEIRSLANEERIAVKKQLSTVSTKIEQTKEYIISLKGKYEDKQAQKENNGNAATSKLKEEKTGLENELTEIQAKLKDAEAEKSSLQENQKSANIELNTINNNAKQINKQLKIFEKDNCPTCGAPLEDDLHLELKNRLETERSENQVAKQEKEAQKKELDGMIKNVDSTLTEHKKTENQLTKKIQELESEIRSNESNVDVEISQLVSILKEQKSKFESLQEEHDRLENEYNVLQVLEDKVLSDKGAKNLVITKILPLFNKSIANIAESVNLPFHLEFNENFSPILKQMGEEISPKTLSAGEKKKADLVIIIAMIEMLKFRYPSLNVLFLDEVLSSIDSDTVPSMVQTIRKTIKNLGLNTYIVGHNNLPIHYFDRVVEVEKQGNFSTLSINEVD